jgi:hypothetical protein
MGHGGCSSSQSGTGGRAGETFGEPAESPSIDPSTAWILALTPVHWLLLSLAAWRALYQLAFAPYASEKTEHELAKSVRRAADMTRSLLELER